MPEICAPFSRSLIYVSPHVNTFSMRKLLLFCLLLPAMLQGQTSWTVVYSNPNHNLVDIQFISPLVGYVAGYKNTNVSSFVLKTTDGGLTWNPAQISLPFINKMHFANDTFGYVSKGGAPMQFAHTTDGGLSWQINALPDSCFVTQGLVAVSDSSGYYINNAGQFRRFSGYGTTITRLADTLGFGVPLVFPTPARGYYTYGTGMNRTSDGGQSWSSLPSSLADIIQWYAFTDTSTGYAATHTGNNTGRIIKTTDGAQSWQPVDNFYAMGIAANNQVVMAVGDTSMVRWSSNGGLGWTTETTGVAWTGSESYVPCVSPGNDAFLITGYNGMILRRLLPLGINETPGSGMLAATLYPNPAGNWVEVKTASGEKMTVEIRTLAGETVLKTETRGRVETAGLAAGCYLLTVKQGDAQCVRKLIRS